MILHHVADGDKLEAEGFGGEEMVSNVRKASIHEEKAGRTLRVCVSFSNTNWRKHKKKN